MEEGTVVVLTTAPTPAVAADIARALVRERLVACGNVVPGLRSLYWWKGEVADEAEALLVLKTQRRLLGELKERLPRLHPYEVPELVALGVEDGLPGYLEWVAGSLRPAGPGRRRARAPGSGGRGGAPAPRRRRGARASGRRPGGRHRPASPPGPRRRGGAR